MSKHNKKTSDKQKYNPLYALHVHVRIINRVDATVIHNMQQYTSMESRLLKLNYTRYLYNCIYILQQASIVNTPNEQGKCSDV